MNVRWNNKYKIKRMILYGVLYIVRIVDFNSSLIKNKFFISFYILVVVYKMIEGYLYVNFNLVFLDFIFI